MITPTSVPAPPSPLRAVTVFLAAGLVVLAAIGVGLGVLQHRSAVDEAVRGAETLTAVLAREVVEPDLTPEALVPGADARDDFASTIEEHVLGGQIVGVKLWDRSGLVLYSDDEDIIGERFPLSPREMAAFGHDRPAVADVSNLEEDENADQRSFGKLMQVYQGVETTGGVPLLFETYHRYDTIAAESRQRFLSFLPVLVGGLVLLWLAQAPLAWRLATRLRAAHDEREQLLVAALAASDRERQRIAADLHDGVVQGLSGASYTLTAEAARLSSSGHRPAGDLLHGLAVDLRRSVRELRSLIVTITPPALRRQPLVASLKDLVAPLEDRGVQVRVDVREDLELEQTVTDLVLRTAQEAVRNILRHAAARDVTLTLGVTDGWTVLSITDDGTGFLPGPRAGRRDSMGLDLLAGLAQQEGGRLEVRSAPSVGTQLDLRIPLAVREPVPA